MTARAYMRGHPVFWDGAMWLWSDTLKPADGARECRLCHKMPTAQGQDPCIACLPGVAHACCGHGVEPPTIVRTPTQEQAL